MAKRRRRKVAVAGPDMRVDLDGDRPDDLSLVYWRHLQQCRRGRWVGVGAEKNTGNA